MSIYISDAHQRWLESHFQTVASLLLQTFWNRNEIFSNLNIQLFLKIRLPSMQLKFSIVWGIYKNNAEFCYRDPGSGVKLNFW